MEIMNDWATVTGDKSNQQGNCIRSFAHLKKGVITA